jgi:hypothetical protein
MENISIKGGDMITLKDFLDIRRLKTEKRGILLDQVFEIDSAYKKYVMDALKQLKIKARHNYSSLRTLEDILKHELERQIIEENLK